MVKRRGIRTGKERGREERGTNRGDRMARAVGGGQDQELSDDKSDGISRTSRER